MMFEKLANGITKHAKLVLAIWVVLIIAAAWPAMHASDSFDYDSTNVGASDTEAMKGAEILTDNFDTLIATTDMQSILITYDPDAISQTDILDIGTLISQSIMANNPLVLNVMTAGQYDTGLLMLAVTYNPELIESEDIQEDTGKLRKNLKNAINDLPDTYDTSSFETYVTGTPAITYDTMETTSKDLSIVDPIAIFMILVLVGLFFRSFVSSAAAPAVIGCALAVVLGVIYFLGQIIGISSSAQMVLIVSMLGAGCDYCIFILSRYREERRSGKDHIAACKEAIMWAGESVATSGCAVMIGFGAMSICSFGMVSSMGIVLALGIVFAILAALTMMSSVLVLVGDRLFWPSGAASPKLEKGYLKKCGNFAHRYFVASTHFSIKHAKAIIVATVLFTVPMTYVYLESDSSYDMIGSMMSGESADGMVVMEDYVGGGAVMPNYVVFESNEDIATVKLIGDREEGLGLLTWTTAANNFSNDLNEYAADIQNIDYIASASTFSSTYNWNYIQNELVTSHGFIGNEELFDPFVLAGLDEISATTTDPALKSNVDTTITLLTLFGSQATAEMQAAISYVLEGNMAINSLKVAQFVDWALYVKNGSLGYTLDDDNTGHVVYAKVTISTLEGALTDNSIDAIDDVYDLIHGAPYKASVKTAWVSGTTAVMLDLSESIGEEFLKIEILAVILIIILLFFVMKSYLTPIRSVVTILMSVVWTVAITHLLFGNLLGDGVMWLIPIILLVICLGLGMDYDILLTTRIKEYVSKGMTNDEAIENAVLHSGSVITICGIIMGGTFGSMMLASTGMLQQMGFALCFAILVDALIVRTYIVPAAMHIMGKWNWVGPSFLQKKKE